VIAAAFLACAALAAAPPEPTPASNDCVPDEASLSAEADSRLAAEDLAAARRLLRAARRFDPSPALALRAADLAFAADDVEEGGDLLAAAAELEPSRLSPPELLLLSRRAEQRRRWTEAAARYADLARALAKEGATAAWIAPRLADLELETQADAIAPPASGPPIEARLALADGKRALAAGRLKQARESLRAALALSPSYVEALLALSAVEARSGRSAAAIRACREALAAEPDRVEALIALANLQWEQPDRAAKEESLAHLDRASILRPDLRRLLRLSAGRWAEYGDASAASERLDRFLASASPRERAEAEPLRVALSRRGRGSAELSPAPAAAPEEPASGAVDRWRKAQVYASRGDPASLDAALALLAEAERLDPTLARAPELAASIHERRSEWREAEGALGRALQADPARAATWESLALLLERDPDRADEAMRAWGKAEQAGSTEALFRLAQAAERRGDDAAALGLYRRSLAEAPDGLRASEAAAAAARLDRRRSVRWLVGATLAAVALAGVAIARHRRRSGLTLAEWLAAHPDRAVSARRIVGRLRHEALKHGGLLLADAAERLAGGDAGTRRATAGLLVSRLYGEGGSPGLVAEAEDASAALENLARADGVRLNLGRRDPVFSMLHSGVKALRRSRRALRLCRDGGSAPGAIRRATRLLRRAARCFQLASGAEIERTVDRAASLPVRLDALQALLAHVAAEADRDAPALELLDTIPADALPLVRISPADWETLWRNLFANALSAGRLGLAARATRDPATGEARLAIVLHDDLPGALTRDDIRNRPSDRGLGVVADILRRHEGSIDVVASARPGFRKGIAIALPASEKPA